MSLNFYSEIDSLQVTNKDEVVIKIKTSGSNLDKQIDELRTLKNDGAVRIMIESAIVAWARETGKSGKEVTSFQEAAEIFDKKIEEAKTAINESCRISYEKGKKNGKEEIIQKFEEKHHVRGASK